MSLPPAFLDELRARTPLGPLVGRRVKLSRSGRNWKGCCPFHAEKSPSFYVYEDGYHCFGCGAHGDAVSFVMQAQGLGFREAVEALAGEAGLEVPRAGPAAVAAEKARLDIHGALDAAKSLFRRQLRASGGGAALAYLRGRGLTDATIEAFGLGWSGDGRGLAAALPDVPPDLLFEAGLLREAEDGSRRALFFNRVMFPIHDRRGRVVSFGGRTLGDGQPKYVNGPETPVFSKRRMLYGADRAREAVRRGAEVVAVEGYMDVIALHQAGFEGAVAPLGTALTEEQFEELWRLSPAPVLCFDGDAAGAKAAVRAAETGLPLMKPERTVRFARLGGGDDPDSLVRLRGPQAFRAVIDVAQPMETCLFDLLLEGAGLGDLAKTGAHSLARFAERLRAAAARIPHQGLSREYASSLLRRLSQAKAMAFEQARGPGRRFTPGAGLRRIERPMARTIPSPASSRAEQARLLTAILLRHPELIHDVDEAFGRIPLPTWLAALREEIFVAAGRTPALDSAALVDHLIAAGFGEAVARALSDRPLPLPGAAREGVMPSEAEAGWWQLYGLMNATELDRDIAAARTRATMQPGEDADARLIALREARLGLFEGDGPASGD